MIQGIGIDLIETERIESAYKEHGEPFLNKLFTAREKKYCFSCKNPYPRLAGRFAAKEAISKALGTGFGSQLSWKDLEILPDDNGRPEVILSDEVKKNLSNFEVKLSISHTNNYATAVAVILLL